MQASSNTGLAIDTHSNPRLVMKARRKAASAKPSAVNRPKFDVDSDPLSNAELDVNGLCYRYPVILNIFEDGDDHLHERTMLENLSHLQSELIASATI